MDNEKREMVKEMVRRQLAQSKIAKRYSTSKECQILRQTIDLLVNPNPLSDDDQEMATEVLNEYQEYNTYVKQCLIDAANEAEAELEARLQAEANARVRALCEADDKS